VKLHATVLARQTDPITDLEGNWHGEYSGISWRDRRCAKWTPGGNGNVNILWAGPKVGRTRILTLVE
jgi:hypothetical protein